MPVHNYYKDGKLVGRGFDSLEEVYACLKNPSLLTSKAMDETLILEDEKRRKLQEDAEFLEWKARVKKELLEDE